jgi:hypothetical protein
LADSRFVNTVCNADRAFRTRLYDEYLRTHGERLDDVLRREVGGACGEALAMLVAPIGASLARALRQELAGLAMGETDGAAAVRILMSQRGRHLAAARGSG